VGLVLTETPCCACCIIHCAARCWFWNQSNANQQTVVNKRAMC